MVLTQKSIKGSYLILVSGTILFLLITASSCSIPTPTISKSVEISAPITVEEPEPVLYSFNLPEIVVTP